MASILVFDSGVGGLSILQAIQAHPQISGAQHRWLFCSDNAFFPYGTKSEDDLIARVCRVLAAINAQYHPDIVVIACNTASTVALQAVRELIPVPVIGVVPAIKPAAALSQSRSIGLLATPATITRHYTQQLIDDFASDCQITRVGSTELVQLAENYLRTAELDVVKLAEILQPFAVAIEQQQLDTMVLACTHFPLLRDFLREQLPQIRYWVDSGEAIARRVLWQLDNLKQFDNLKQLDDSITSSAAIFTREDNSMRTLADFLRRLDLQLIRICHVDQ